uniref:hypothetical protein n=1 Tax=Candidatus Wunengus sp. YC61 TaxID=3367698 RepID=UPI0040268CDA
MGKRYGRGWSLIPINEIFSQSNAGELRQERSVGRQLHWLVGQSCVPFVSWLYSSYEKMCHTPMTATERAAHPGSIGL